MPKFILEKYDTLLADEATPAKLENKTQRGKGKSPPREFWRTFEPYASGRLRHPGAVDADHTGWGLISGNKCLDIITHLRLRQSGTGVEVVYQPMEAWGGKKHGRVAEGGRYLTEDFRGLASRGKSAVATATSSVCLRTTSGHPPRRTQAVAGPEVAPWPRPCGPSAVAARSVC